MVVTVQVSPSAPTVTRLLSRSRRRRTQVRAHTEGRSSTSQLLRGHSTRAAPRSQVDTAGGEFAINDSICETSTQITTVRQSVSLPTRRVSVNDDIVMVTRTCDECGFPILAPTGAPCPYCDTHATSAQFAKRMQAALYGLPLATLQRVKLALRSQAPAAASEAHPPLAEWIASRDGNSGHDHRRPRRALRHLRGTRNARRTHRGHRQGHPRQPQRTAAAEKEPVLLRLRSPLQEVPRPQITLETPAPEALSLEGGHSGS